MTCSRKGSQFGQISCCGKAALYELVKGVVELSPGSCQGGTALLDAAGQLWIEYDEARSQDSPVGLDK